MPKKSLFLLHHWVLRNSHIKSNNSCSLNLLGLTLHLKEITESVSVCVCDFNFVGVFTSVWDFSIGFQILQKKTKWREDYNKISLCWEVIKSKEKAKPQNCKFSFPLSPVSSLKYLANKQDSYYHTYKWAFKFYH